MKPTWRPRYTLAELMIVVALTAIEAVLVRSALFSEGPSRLFAMIGVAWFLPLALLLIYSLRDEAGWGYRLLHAWRCPRCARRSLLPLSENGRFECDACGSRYLRCGDGIWIDDPRPVEERGKWVGPFLARLRAIRGRMRPSVLPPLRLDLVPSDRFPNDGEGEEFAVHSRRARRIATRPKPIHLLGMAAVWLALIGVVVAGVRIVRTGREDVLLVPPIVFCSIYYCLGVGIFGQFSWSRIVLMLTATLGLQIIHLSLLGHAETVWLAILGIAVTLPGTPFLLGFLMRRYPEGDVPVEESTPGLLLRSKQGREGMVPGCGRPSSP